MDALKNFVSRYLFAVILVLAGFIFLIYGFSNDQTIAFKVGGLALILVGVIAGLYQKGIISKQVQTILSVVLILFSTYLAYQSYASVNLDIEFRAEKQKVSSLTIQRLKDIRTAQIAYKNKYGFFTDNFDTLINFVKFDSLPIVTAIGSVPDTLTERQALELGLIIRDTINVPVFESIFPKDDANRRLYRFRIDSFATTPFVREQFVMRSGMLERGGGVFLPVFEVVDPKPFPWDGVQKFQKYTVLAKDTLKVGSMNEPSTNGNWAGE
ncbi:MAG: hypothetical protein ACXITV_01550 [Luteibaculaceae bacterium]